MQPRFNTILRTFLLASRWGMAPFFLGLIVALLIVLAQFFRGLAQALIAFPGMDGSAVMLAVLRLVDLVLVANLVVMIIAVGVEIYLPIAAPQDENRPALAGMADFSGLKLKLFASISAIAAIDLLESFLNIDPADKSDVLWDILILMTFVASGVLLALMDRLAVGRH